MLRRVVRYWESRNSIYGKDVFVSRPNGTWRRFCIEMNVFGVNVLEMIGYGNEWLIIAGYRFTSRRRSGWWIALDK